MTNSESPLSAFRDLASFYEGTIKSGYQRGYLGGSGLETVVPSQLEDFVAYCEGQAPKEPERIAAFMIGYQRGLADFLREEDLAKGRDFAAPKDLERYNVLVGYLRGLKLERPNFPRDYTVLKPRAMSLEEADLRRGYALGFAVGIVRESGLKLTSLQIPIDDFAYKTFMAGFANEPQPSIKSSQVEEVGFNQLSDSEVQTIRKTFEVIDGLVYQAGVEVGSKLTQANTSDVK